MYGMGQPVCSPARRWLSEGTDETTAGHAGPGGCGGGVVCRAAGGRLRWGVSAAGSWGKAIEVPGTGKLNAGGSAYVNAVSCAPPGNCAAGGRYGGSDGIQAFVASEVNGQWRAAM